MIDILLIVALLIVIASLVCGIYAQGYSVHEVVLTGWARLKEIYWDWRR